MISHFVHTFKDLEKVLKLGMVVKKKIWQSTTRLMDSVIVVMIEKDIRPGYTQIIRNKIYVVACLNHIKCYAMQENQGDQEKSKKDVV